MALQTKTFTSGSTKSSELNYYALDLVLTEESTSSAENSSTISYELRLRSGNISFSLFGLGASISLSGKTVATRNRYSAPQMSMSANSTLVILSGNTKVTHDDSGSKSMSVAFSIDMEKSSVTPGPVSVTGETMILTSIGRASTIGATDANVGAVSVIAVTKKADSHTHSIAYRFGSLSGYVKRDGTISDAEVKFGDTSVAFVIPNEFYDQIPNSRTGKCILTCRTYSGTTKIGDDQTAEFTATASEAACKPSVSGTVLDSNQITKALTGDETKLVRYFSTALCTIAASARNGATISQKKIGGTEVTGDTRSIESSEGGSIVFYAKDSRGYENSVIVNPTIIPYVKLTNNTSGKRTDQTSGGATLIVAGNYYNASFGAENNSLTVKYRVGDGDYTEATPTVNGNTYSAAINLSGLSYEQSYEVETVVSDKLSKMTKTLPIARGIPVFDWGNDDFRINALFRLLGVNYGTSLPATGKPGQVFFLQSGGSYGVKIHDGVSWK